MKFTHRSRGHPRPPARKLASTQESIHFSTNKLSHTALPRTAYCGVWRADACSSSGLRQAVSLVVRSTEEALALCPLDSLMCPHRACTSSPHAVRRCATTHLRHLRTYIFDGRHWSGPTSFRHGFDEPTWLCHRGQPCTERRRVPWQGGGVSSKPSRALRAFRQ
jgi:hypothetical protein